MDDLGTLSGGAQQRRTARDFPQELLELYDFYAHGIIDRRTFLDRAAKFAVGGLTATALLSQLSPNYALAQQVAPDDSSTPLHTMSYW